jgi:hypothetical protein
MKEELKNLREGIIDYLNVKSSPMKYSLDEIRELQILVVEIKDLKN